MRAGLLDRKIQIVEITSAPPPDEPWGQPVETEMVIATPLANFLQQSAREWLRDGITTTETRAVFRIRYHSGITTNHIIARPGERWDITEVREIGRRKGLDIYAVLRG